MSEPPASSSGAEPSPVDLAAAAPAELAARAAAATPADSPLTMDDWRESAEVQGLSTPKLEPGDAAFDFELPRLDLSEGVERRIGGMIRLSEFAGGKPVALIFGSYT